MTALDFGKGRVRSSRRPPLEGRGSEQNREVRRDGAAAPDPGGAQMLKSVGWGAIF